MKLSKLFKLRHAKVESRLGLLTTENEDLKEVFLYNTKENSMTK